MMAVFESGIVDIAVGVCLGVSVAHLIKSVVCVVMDRIFESRD